MYLFKAILRKKLKKNSQVSVDLYFNFLQHDRYVYRLPIPLIRFIDSL